MPRSGHIPGSSARCGRPRAPRARPATSRGFTLLELVVVMLILTIILGMVGVRLTRDESDVVRDEARRLALVMQNAHEQAILEGRPYAFALTDDGYQFLRLGDKGKLVPVKADEILAPRRLPRAIALYPRKTSDDARRADVILFDPAGEFPAFTMVFEAGDILWHVHGHGDGRIESTAAAEPEAS